MIPRKPNSYFPEIASELDIPEELVESVVNFYWKDVRKQLAEPEKLNIVLIDFGVFEIRRKQVEYLIAKYKRILTGMKVTTYSKHAIFNVVTEKLARMEKMLELCNQQDEKKKQVRELQKNGKTV